MNEIITNIVAALVAGGAALIGAYLGTRWAFGRFLQERRFDEMVVRRDVLRDFLGDAADYDFFFGNCDKGKIDREVGQDLLRRLVRLEAHFVNDPRIGHISSVIEEFVGMGLDGKISHHESPFVANEFSKLKEILAEIEGTVVGERRIGQIEDRRRWWKFSR